MRRENLIMDSSSSLSITFITPIPLLNRRQFDIAKDYTTSSASTDYSHSPPLRISTSKRFNSSTSASSAFRNSALFLYMSSSSSSSSSSSRRVTTVSRSSTLRRPSNSTSTRPSYTTVNPFNADDHFHHELISSRRRSNNNSNNPIIIIPGFGAPATAYKDFRDILSSSLPDDAHVSVVPITLREWAMSVGGRPMTAVLRVVDETVQSVLSQTGASKVTLIGHSAGGWIARVYLGDKPYPNPSDGIIWHGRPYVNQLVCLGTPHDSGEPVTKENMHFVNSQYPGAYYDDIEYINFAGDGVIIPPFHVPSWKFWHPFWMSRLSYKLTDPDIKDEEHAIGDGIVPLSVTFLSGADVNVRLKGVCHSYDSKGPWYGDEQVVRFWSKFLK